MNDQALANLKSDAAALRAAYLDVGGKIGDGRHHNFCPFCNDATGFMLGEGQNNFAVWACYAGKSDKCAIPAGRKVSGTIVDLIVKARGVDSKEACRIALEKYSNAHRKDAKTQRTEGNEGTEQTKSGQSFASSRLCGERKPKGKLHVTPDLAFEAAAFGIRQRVGNTEVQLVKYWKYCDEKGEPRVEVARFDLLHHGQKAKEFAPIHRDGNGWRVGAGEWGRARKFPLYRLSELLTALRSKGEN